MKTTARMQRKEPALDVQNCVIDMIHILPENEYRAFTRNMLDDYDFIEQHSDKMCVDRNGITHCLLVMGEGVEDGVLVNSEGSSYGRYTSILPNARTFIDAQIKKLADYIVSEGTEHTEDGRWSNTYDELFYHFGTTVTDDNGTVQLLIDELKERDEVAGCIATEDCIEMSYHLEYCPECQQGGIEGTLNLMSLMGCNLEDVHLCDVDEEHDLATIVELNQNTLTEQGKEDWADVLSAKVESIYTGYYGLQIGISGASPDRLRDFSYMLAGQCSCEDYDKWVNDADEGPTQKM